MARILGIDPGTNVTGIGVIDMSDSVVKYVYHEALKTGIKNKYSQKLACINKTIEKIIKQYNNCKTWELFYFICEAKKFKSRERRYD